MKFIYRKNKLSDFKLRDLEECLPRKIFLGVYYNIMICALSHVYVFFLCSKVMTSNSKLPQILFYKNTEKIQPDSNILITPRAGGVFL